MASVISASTTSATALNMTADTSGILQIATGATPTTAVTVDASQNVGIGTSNPTQKLQVYTSAASGGQIQITNASTGATSTDGVLIGYDSLNDVIINNQENTAMKFYNVGSEKMRIDTSGQVLINATSNPTASIDKLFIVGGAVTKGTTANYNSLVFYNTSNVLAGYINCNGTTTTYVTSSDYRLKEDVKPIVGALDKVTELKPVTYKWKADGSDGQGFIAHELQAVVPDCVVGEKDAVNQDGSIKPQGIDTSFLVATLTAAIQELNAKVTALEAKVGK